jgi:hypothetical protein
VSRLPKSCIVCGARTDGASRCPVHASQAGRLARSCVECGARSAGNYCLAHDPATNPEVRLARQPWRAAYSDPAYQAARLAELEAANWRCRNCGRRRGQRCKKHGRPIRLQIDHVVELSSATTPDELAALSRPENLRALCECCCHRAKTADRARSRRGTNTST